MREAYWGLIIIAIFALAVGGIYIGASAWNNRPNPNGIVCEYVTSSTEMPTVIIYAHSTTTIGGATMNTTETMAFNWGDCP